MDLWRKEHSLWRSTLTYFGLPWADSQAAALLSHGA